jgi:hypothetical protein
MKVHEIISEAGYADALASIVKGVGQFFRGTKGELVELLAGNKNVMEKLLRGSRPTVAEIEAMYGKEAAELYKSNPDIINKAQIKYTRDVADARRTTNPSSTSTTVTKDADTTVDALKNEKDPSWWQRRKDMYNPKKAGGFIPAAAAFGNTAMNVLILLQIWEPISIYNDKVNDFGQWLLAGKDPTGKPYGPENYKADRTAEMGLLITKMAAILATTLAVKGVGSAVGGVVGTSSMALQRLAGMSPKMSYLGSAIKGAGNIGALFATMGLNSETGTKWLAEFIALWGVDMVIGHWGLVGLDAITDLGAWKTRANDVLEKLGQGRPLEEPVKPKQQPGAKSEIDKIFGQGALPSETKPGEVTGYNSSDIMRSMLAKKQAQSPASN